MTKQEVIKQLKKGKVLSDLFIFTEGQECLIHKGNFAATDDIIYIPDIYLNEISTNNPLTEEKLEDIENNLYSGNDFINECNGNVELAKELFDWCDWSHPSSALTDILLGYDEEEFYDKFGVKLEEFK